MAEAPAGRLLPGPGWALAAFVAYLLPALFVWTFLIQLEVVVPPARGEPLRAEHIEWGMVCQTANCLCAIGLVLLAWPGAGFHRVGTVRALLAYGAFLLLWVPVFLLLYLTVMRELGEPVQAQPHLLYFAAADPSRPGMWLAVLVAGLLGPLAEEVVFRGYLHGAARLYVGRHAAVWSVALVFGLVHGLDKALPLAALGALLGYLREATGSLWAPFLVHAVHNSLTVALVAFQPRLVQELYSR